MATSDGFCATYADARCSAWARCGNIDSALVAACIGLIERDCHGAIGARLDAGASVLDLPAAQGCLDSFVDRPCQSFDVLDETGVCSYGVLLRANAGLGERCGSQADCHEGRCGTAVGKGRCPHCEGGLPIGSPCQVSWLCDDTGRCAPTALADGGSELRCAARLPDGDPCSDDLDCAAGYCYRLGGPGRCGKAAPGGACLIYSDRDCPAGYYCEDSAIPGTDGGSGSDAGPALPSQGACMPRVATGQPCSNGLYDDGCADRAATCLSGSCVVTAPGSLPRGAECDQHHQCVAGHFCDHVIYGVSSVGTCQPWLANGASCQRIGCASDARCIAGTCQRSPELGTTCTSTIGCRFLASCSATTQTCKGPGNLGDTCDRSASLCIDSYCDAVVSAGAGRCVAFLDAGSICTHARDVIAPFICSTQSCYPAADGGDFTECVDCLPGAP